MPSVVQFPSPKESDKSLSRDTPDEDDGPTPEDLAALEDEWPLIEAELDLVDAEIAVLSALPHVTDLDWRRWRRANARVARVAAELYAAGRLPAATEAAAA